MNQTNVRRFMIAFAAALAIMGSSVSQAQASNFIINFTDSGWYDATGAHSSANKNYAVGSDGSTTFRNYFVFDMSSVTGTITSATLNIFNPTNGQGGTIRTFTVYDVTTSIATLMASNSGATGIFTDLGTGTVLGTNSTSQTNNTVTNTSLNSSGLAYLQSKVGLTGSAALIAFGGDYPGASGVNYLFGFTGGSTDDVRQLVIETGSVPPVAVPVPAGFVMSSLGALGIGGLSWLRRRKTKIA